MLWNLDSVSYEKPLKHSSTYFCWNCSKERNFSKLNSNFGHVIIQSSGLLERLSGTHDSQCISDRYLVLIQSLQVHESVFPIVRLLHSQSWGYQSQHFQGQTMQAIPHHDFFGQSRTNPNQNFLSSRKPGRSDGSYHRILDVSVHLKETRDKWKIFIF